MLRAGQTIMICVIALLTIGLVMVTSAGLSLEAGARVSIESMLTSRTFAYALMAVALMVAGSYFNVEWLLPRGGAGPGDAGGPGASRGRSPMKGLLTQSATWIFSLCVIMLGLVYVPGVGRVMNGAHRWVNLGPESWGISFQPSEVAKWAMIVVLGCYVVGRGPERMKRFWTGLVPGLILVMILCGIIVLEDLGTAMLIGLVSLVLLYAGGARLRHIAILFPLPIAIVVLAVLTSQYRQERILSFIDPYADPQGSGYHMIQSMVAIAEGKITGRGLGHGIFKFGYLPEDTTDFLFAVICEESGVFGAGLVAFLYVLLVGACVRVSARQRHELSMLVGLGVTATIGLQTLINLFVVTGMAPTKGIALPLLSAGGTGWMLTAFSLGLLVGMDRRTNPALHPDAPACVSDDSPQVRTSESLLSAPGRASVALRR